MQQPNVLVRAYNFADQKTVQALLNQIDNADPSLETHAYALLDATIPNHNQGLDRFVLEIKNQIVGYGFVGGERKDRNDCWLCILEECRLQGLGRLLLEKMIEHSKARAVTGLMAYLPGKTPALGFAVANGFSVRGYFRELKLKYQKEIGGAFQNGLSLLPYSEHIGLQRLTAVMQKSYDDLWGHGISTLESVQNWLPYFPNNHLLLILDERQQDIGIVRIMENTNTIDAPGIVSAARNPENYMAALSATLQMLNSKPEILNFNTDIILESWGDADQTIKAYQSLGFVITAHTAIVGREI